MFILTNCFTITARAIFHFYFQIIFTILLNSSRESLSAFLLSTNMDQIEFQSFMVSLTSVPLSVDISAYYNGLFLGPKEGKL